MLNPRAEWLRIFILIWTWVFLFLETYFIVRAALQGRAWPIVGHSVAWLVQAALFFYTYFRLGHWKRLDP